MKQNASLVVHQRDFVQESGNKQAVSDIWNIKSYSALQILTLDRSEFITMKAQISSFRGSAYVVGNAWKPAPHHIKT